MVNQFGECVHAGQDGYNSGMDFRVAQARNLTVQPLNRSTEAAVSVPQSWHFPALAAAYCEKDDAICSAWAAAQRCSSSNETIDSRFCIGTAGCVAISVCEASRSQLERCYSYRTYQPFAASESGLPLSVVFIGTMSMLFALLCCCWCLRRPDHPRAVEAAGANGSDTSAVTDRPHVQRRQDVERMDIALPRTQLDLAGWRVQRAERIEQEKLQLAGAGDVDVVVEWRVQCNADEHDGGSGDGDGDGDGGGDATSYVCVDDTSRYSATTMSTMR
ncbi:hypothetical protein PINS_up009336 [Pythium insidiosum]|nr:hypothetical protein PINS_up009336 [Pythium insidiosum]